MRQVFAKRQADFRSQCLKYLRYVLNDHFVLFLLIFIGFLAVQYSQLLRNFPADPLPIQLGLLLVSLALLPFGRIATYLEEPDALFLLVKEDQVSLFVRAQGRRAYLFYGVLQTAVLVLLAPLFFRLGFPVWAFALYCLALLGIKWLIFQRKLAQFFGTSGLNWQRALAYEARRKQTILRFFALFTTVKGISNSVKRRAYLDGLTQLLPKRHDRTWHNLFLRSFLRNGDLLALSLRLLLLSLLVLIFVSQSWISAAFVILFNYLLLFQLTALYEVYDYQYLTQLFPIGLGEKRRAARQLIFVIGCSQLVLQGLTALLVFADKRAALALLGGTLLLYLFYLPFKLRRLVD